MKTRTLALVFLIGFLLVLPGHAWGAGEQVKLDPARVAVDFPVIISPKVWPYATGQGTLNGHTTLVGCRCPYLVAHELGHSFGWMHANFWRVTAGSPISPDGEEVEYGDPFDIMGDQLQGRPRAFHHFNPWFKARAGWIPPANILQVTQSRVYAVTIRALERAPQQGPEVTEYTAVRIPKDPGRDYWLFYRSQVLADELYRQNRRDFSHNELASP